MGRQLTISLVVTALVSILIAGSGCFLFATPTNSPVAGSPTAVGSGGQASSGSRPTSPGQSFAPGQANPSAPAPSALSVIDAAAKARPAVVNITSQIISYDMFLRPASVEAGVGSGVIVDPKGYILTNNHVVAAASSLKVTLPDGRSFEGKVVGADERTDLAVAKIEGDDLPVAELGDSDKLQIGEQVVAIGNALALPGGPTVTAGVVGAVGRQIRTDNGNILYDLIQTDAAINPGNSGGPLINLAGQVVGINTAIANAPGGGIGFSIAINSAKPVMADLLALGRVRRPWLGIEMADVTPSAAAAYNLSVASGVWVGRVFEGSPAAQAGLQAGDVIVAIDNDQISDSVKLLKAIANQSPGSKVRVIFYRGSQLYWTEVTLQEMP
ncbi:MAG: S1C family serine protease [Chloroflexota bacterium]